MRSSFVFAAGFLFFLTLHSYGQNYEIDSLELVLSKTQDAKEEINILNKLAFHYTRTSVTESEKYGQEALRKAQKIRYLQGMAEAFKVLGLVSSLRSEYNRSVEYSYEALKLYEQIGDKAGQAKVLNNLGLVLMTLHEYDQALRFTNRSLHIKREIGDSVGVANSILALGEYYRHKEDFSKALALCGEALAKHTALNDDLGISYDHYQLGEVYFDQQNFTKASLHYHQAVLHARLGKDEIQVISSFEKLGQSLLKSQKQDSGYFYLHRALKLSRERNSRKNEMRACELLGNYFVSINRFDSAYYYARTTVLIQQDIFKTQRSQQVATMQMLYDFEKKEQELDFQKTIVKRQYVAIAGVTLILILAAMLGIKFYRLNKANQQSKEELLKLNAEIHTMNENLETLVRQRTEELKQQNQRLIEYAFFTAHEVRGPLARILGLVELSKINTTPEDRVEILKRLEISAYELDEIIRMINRKLENGKKL